MRQAVEQEGINGKRVLAIGFRKVDDNTFSKGYDQSQEKDLTFLGYFVFEDPLKPTTIEAIRLSKKLGVQIKIITGDSKEVSEYVAKKINLMTADQVAILGEELEAMSEVDFDQACLDHVVFARISPEIKYNIIKSLQKKYDVGFLGEGINDAPALKISDVAIVVDGASDVAREASDIVLLERSLKVILDGIEGGRKVFENTSKYITATMASNFGNFFAIAIIAPFINFLPMLPLQILLVNLLSDFPMIMVATDNVDEEALTTPKRYNLRSFATSALSFGFISTSFDFVLFSLFVKHGEGQLQTYWFIESILSELLFLFSIRSQKAFFATKLPSKPLVYLTIFTIILTLAIPFTSIGRNIFGFIEPNMKGLLIVFAIVFTYLLSNEAVKLFLRRLASKGLAL